MITPQLLNPQSIVVIGGSNDINKPGGKVLKNLIDNNYSGELYVANPKMDEVQGIKSFKNPAELPQCDLAILAIAAKYCPMTVEMLAKEKQTRAFIILSAGFSEENEEGAKLEQQIVDTVNKYEASLIGPNCVGMMNQNYAGVFTTPIPKLEKRGVDFISGSGATAVFIMESGIPKGLSFNSVYSVGNSAQIGFEEVVKCSSNTPHRSSAKALKLLQLNQAVPKQVAALHPRIQVLWPALMLQLMRFSKKQALYAAMDVKNLLRLLQFLCIPNSKEKISPSSPMPVVLP